MWEPNLISVTAVEPYETGEVKLFDARVHGTANCATRRISIDGGAGIAWANGQDLAPHELYELSVAAPGR